MKEFFDLDTLLENNQKVYVRNNAVKANLLIIVQMQDSSGRKRALKVPPTRFPICVSSNFSQAMIRESSDLRDAIHKGVLILVDPKMAERELQSDEAKEEMKSYALSVYSDTAPNNAVRDNLQRLKSETSDPVVDSTDLLKGSGISEDDVQPRVKGLVASVSNKEKPSKEILIQLKRLKSGLTETDLTYIIKECPKETQIREFAEAALAELSASPEAPFQE